MQVRISDANGAVIRTMELGEKKVGVYTLDWDGKNDAGVPMEAGAYTVSVTASDAEGKKVAAEMLSYGKVKSVAYSTNGLRLTWAWTARPACWMCVGDRRLSAAFVPLYI